MCLILGGAGWLAADDEPPWPLLALIWQAGGAEQGAQFGASVVSGDFNGDGYPDLAVGAPKYSGGAYRSGVVFIYYSRGFDWPVAPDLTLTLPQTGSRFGAALACGDFNGDGRDDLLVGAPEYHNGETRSGAVFLYNGGAGGLSAAPDWTWISEQTGSLFGHSVANAGDVNGNGYPDLLIGAPVYALPPDSVGGAVFLWYGSADGPGETADWTAAVNQNLAHFGYAVAGAGDVNGDGYADLAVGAPRYKTGGEALGALFVYHGAAAGPGATADWTAVGPQPGARFGEAVAAAGDVNGDGYADLLVSARLASDQEEREGAVYVYHGRAGGLEGTPAWTRYGGQAWSGWGAALLGAVDMDDDGYDDIVIGAPFYSDDQSLEGGAFVFRGTAVGLQNKPAWTAWGDKAETEFGAALSGVVEEGRTQLLVGAPAYRKERIIVGRSFLYRAGPDDSPHPVYHYNFLPVIVK